MQAVQPTAGAPRQAEPASGPAFRRGPLSNYADRGVNADRWAAIEQHAGRSVLDAGCGNGSYVLALRQQRTVFGVDQRPFDAWKAAPELFRVCDLTTLDMQERRFETVLCFEVLEHLDDPLALLRRLHSIAERNVIISVPNCRITPGMRASMLCQWHWIDPTHVNFFDLENLSELVEEAGFRVQEARLINRMNLDPLLGEAFGGGVANRALLRVLRAMPRREYHLTCLLVGSK